MERRFCVPLFCLRLPCQFLVPFEPCRRVFFRLRVELVRDFGERALQGAEADLALQEVLEAFRRFLRVESEGILVGAHQFLKSTVL